MFTCPVVDLGIVLCTNSKAVMPRLTTGLAEKAQARYGYMYMKTKKIIPWVITIIIIGGLVSLLIVQAKKPGKYDNLAQCINNSGAKFYGAFWCPHCQATKAMFGKSAKLLPYVPQTLRYDGYGNYRSRRVLVYL